MAKDALEKLEKESEPFFALVSDLNMPEMNGEELIKKTRDIGVLFERVILFSSFAGVDQIAKELNKDQPEEKKVKVVMKGTSDMWINDLSEALG
jgi:CheY-like chemotaxis protein